MTYLKHISVLALSVACLAHSVQADEASALATLAKGDATLEAKANACDELGRVGTAKAVPVLVKLLADDKLHAYARDGLERIPDPAAGKALLAALDTLKGNHRVGVIMTLGDRREKAAVPALAKIAKGKGHAASAALTSLAQLATDESTKAILSVLKKGESKTAAGKAALLAAQVLEQAGDKKAAAKLRKAVAGADVPAAIKKAAGG